MNALFEAGLIGSMNLKNKMIRSATWEGMCDPDGRPEKEAYNLKVSLAVKNVVSCPVISVGGFRSYKISQKVLEEHGLDFISFARPLIREPDLPLRWQSGDHAPAACISCNSCFKPGLFKGRIYCVAKEREKQGHF